MWWQFITLPVGGGLIGWFTNHLAIRMLFRPRRPRRLLGVTLQGVIPRRRAELAQCVAEAIEREFLSHDDIRATLDDPEYQQALGRRVEERLRQFLGEKLASGPRVLRAVVTDTMVDLLAGGAAREVTRRLPALIDGAMGEFETHFDIRQVVRDKIESFDLDRLEALVLELTRTELRFIEALGGIVGAVVGLLLAAIQLLVDSGPR